MKQMAFLVAAAFCLSACVSQNEMALANNVYKLDIDARGLIAMSEAKQSAQRRAAELTLAKGYTHYIITDAQSYESARVVGRTPIYANTNVNFVGNTAFGRTNVYGGQPIVQPRSSTSLVVVMFKAPHIPGNALDAAAILGAKRG